MSPFDSSSAFFASIIPAPVRWRRLITSFAVNISCFLSILAWRKAPSATHCLKKRRRTLKAGGAFCPQAEGS
jgi:hypothetical protein